MPRYRLSDLDLDFISLVPAGDDPLAQVVIAKAEPVEISKPGKKYRPNPKSSPKEIAGSHGHKPHGPSILWPALYEHLRKKGYSKEKAARISNSAWNKKKAGMKTNTPTSVRGLVKGLIIKHEEAALLDAVFNPESDKSGEADTESSTIPANDPTGEETNVADEITKDDLPDEVVEYIEALEAEVTNLNEAVTKAKEAPVVEKAEPSDPFEAALAKADPAVAEILKAQKAQIEQAEAIAKAERDARLEREFISKAEQLPMISDNKAELAGLLRTVAEKLAPAEVEKVETLLKAANAQIAKGNLFSEFGRSGAETTVSKSVKAMAEGIRKDRPELTVEQAESLVYEQHPDLYMASLKEG